MLTPAHCLMVLVTMSSSTSMIAASAVNAEVYRKLTHGIANELKTLDLAQQDHGDIVPTSPSAHVSHAI